jgi:hypothetical protein
MGNFQKYWSQNVGQDFMWHTLKPGIHDASFASKSPFKFLEFKFFDRVYHTRNLNQKTWTDLDGNLDAKLASCIPGLSNNLN